jgi:hypothetical protein
MSLRGVVVLIQCFTVAVLYFVLLCCVAQKIKKLIDEKYRINLVLDNLPVTAQDLLDEVRWGPTIFRAIAVVCSVDLVYAAEFKGFGVWLRHSTWPAG